MKEYITYEEFGAVGDGQHDDMQAIHDAHEKANELGLPVRAKEGAQYNVGHRNYPATIMTDTDWTGATFIVDDCHLEKRDRHIFEVCSSLKEYPIELGTLKKGQTHLNRTFDTDVIITVRDENVRQFIRYGVNQNKGSAKNDRFICRKDGTIESLVVWDFDHISSCICRPIDETPLTIRGGHFRRFANEGTFDEETQSFIGRYDYHCRGILVSRSNTTLDGIKFTVENENEIGDPYAGDINIEHAAHVTIQNCLLTGHKLFWTTLPTGKSPMGTYGLSIGGSCDIKLLHLRQTVDIHDPSRWGVMGTNFCKDILMDDCILSRFDAHQGVTNCTIKHSKFGWQCLHAIGFGVFQIEDTECTGRSFFDLRYDYGCHWDGTLQIKDCTFYATNEHSTIVSAGNSGTHDFGYVAKMPHTIEIDHMTVVTSQIKDKKNLAILPNYDEDRGDATRPFPYVPCEHLRLHDVKTDMGEELDIYHCDERLYPNLTVERF